MAFYDPNRNQKAAKIRNDATALSTAAKHPEPQPNRDEEAPYIFSFTKGLLHQENGLLNDPQDFELFAQGTETPDPEVFRQVPLNTNLETFFDTKKDTFADKPCKGDQTPYRQWESPTAGFAYVLEGPDPFAISMPAAPAAGSAEFAAEMAEVYQMALSRDEPAAAFMDANLIGALRLVGGGNLSQAARNRLQGAHDAAAAAAERLSQMQWFRGNANSRDTNSSEERSRRRFGVAQTPQNLFRGLGEDAWETPFLSQFLVMGDGGCERKLKARASGMISYGAQRIDQRVRIAQPCRDYMTTWRSWLDVQNALNKRPLVDDEFIDCVRPISRLRDLATYVHDDQLYQAYLNAALIMLGERHGFDPGLPYHGATGNQSPRWNREPFALFGPPHLLTLVTEVSSRALKAVRAQKFSVHRRLRPEAAGALFHTIYSGYNPNREHGSKAYALGDGSPEAKARAQLGRTLAGYSFPAGGGSDPALADILTDIRLHNAAQNREDPKKLNHAKWLMPMAFPEGSPMHPSYGAGHATVAGACVTLLKAFFSMHEDGDTKTPAYLVKPNELALVPDGGVNAGSAEIDMLCAPIAKGLTLEGELNKLMWNISNARNIAGVHYYTDYIESALLGEAITLGILREQMLAYEPKENVSLTVPLLAKRTLPAALRGPSIGEFDEVEAVRITNTGELQPVQVSWR